MSRNIVFLRKYTYIIFINDATFSEQHCLHLSMEDYQRDYPNPRSNKQGRVKNIIYNPERFLMLLKQGAAIWSDGLLKHNIP